MRVLVAEDDRLIREALAELLTAEGYRCVTAADGAQTMALFRQGDFDFVCLDIMMPRKSGYDVCREIRALDPRIPILFLSAKSEEIDRVLGLELGADDYLMKPFGARELIARIRAIRRRCTARPKPPASDDPFPFGALRVVPRELRAHGEVACVELTPLELGLLRLLAENEGEVVTRDRFFDVCWGFDHVPNSRTLDQHISQLRKKLEPDPSRPRWIHTVRGVGYRYEVRTT